MICADKEGRRLFDKCLIVPNINPAPKVQRANRPISISLSITGERNRQHL